MIFHWSIHNIMLTNRILAGAADKALFMPLPGLVLHFLHALQKRLQLCLRLIIRVGICWKYHTSKVWICWIAWKSTENSNTMVFLVN
jgi:hypothetical protein